MKLLLILLYVTCFSLTLCYQVFTSLPSNFALSARSDAIKIGDVVKARIDDIDGDLKNPKVNFAVSAYWSYFFLLICNVDSTQQWASA